MKQNQTQTQNQAPSRGRQDQEQGQLKIQLNGAETSLQGVQTVHELVHQLGYQDKRIAIERNGDIVPRSQYTATPLAPNDRIEIVIAVGGG